MGAADVGAGGGAKSDGSSCNDSGNGKANDGVPERDSLAKTGETGDQRQVDDLVAAIASGPGKRAEGSNGRLDASHC